MSDRLDTLMAKMQEALPEYYAGNWPELRAVLRLALAELPLIRAEYERELNATKALLRCQGGPDIPERGK